jgi:hypothetical protein
MDISSLRQGITGEERMIRTEPLGESILRNG